MKFLNYILNRKESKKTDENCTEEKVSTGDLVYNINIEKLSADIDELARVCKDEKLKGAIQRLGHKARESKMVTNEKTAAIDERLHHEVDILASLIRIDYSAAMEKISEITNILEERNAGK